MSLDEFGDEFRMVGEISIHEDNEIARSELQAIDISTTKSKFACSNMQYLKFIHLFLLRCDVIQMNKEDIFTIFVPYNF